jgi:hypothetical protein
MALAVRGTGEKIRITVSAWAAGMAQASREWVQSGCRSDASRQRRCRAGGLKVLSAAPATTSDGWTIEKTCTLPPRAIFLYVGERNFAQTIDSMDISPTCRF